MKKCTFIDLAGQKFNSLSVLERADNDRWGCTQFLCECDCGTQTIVKSSKLKSGHTKTCGCLKSLVSSLQCHRYNDTINNLKEKYGLKY